MPQAVVAWVESLGIGDYEPLRLTITADITRDYGREATEGNVWRRHKVGQHVTVGIVHETALALHVYTERFLAGVDGEWTMQPPDPNRFHFDTSGPGWKNIGTQENPCYIYKTPGYDDGELSQ